MTATYARAALILGVAAMVSSVFALSPGAPESVDFVHVRAPGGVILLVLGLLAVLGSRIHRAPLVILAGSGLAAAAVLQLVLLGLQPNWLGGDGSTLSLTGGLGLGLLAVGLTARLSPAPTHS